MHKDYLIIGQGIAGSILSFELLERGYSLSIADRPGANVCSQKAAGLCNPITGRHFALTWKAREIFEAFPLFYTQWEQKLNKQVWHPMPLYRLAKSIKQENQLLSRLSDPQFDKWAEELPHGQLPHGFRAGMRLKKGGYVEARAVLKAHRNYLQQQQAYIPEWVDAEVLAWQKGKWLWKGHTFSTLIFCTGWKGIAAFGTTNLPIIPNRGLTAHSSESGPQDHIRMAGAWVVPKAEGGSMAGSTYHRHAKDTRFGPEEERQVRDKVEKAWPNYRVDYLDAGIRPTTPDHKPLLGALPKWKNTYVFSGWGSKGFSTAPFLAPLFVDYLEGKKELPEEVQLNRFF